ncbi:type VI secretion system baseplate subunit TssF [uncultured Lacinutrix sp.]|uniref:type VI secretion system baseplate subunit TssF n=1 Tax=uncultured Lacinutrix sp. TaxID=574032 RepID=UPI0026398DB4|nr:type VI secretion system baseplate subunit TssF [uncultured Lacinutrix sp.]
MKTESFEHIKNRMIKKAASIWGVASNEIETSFDPIISLLISACASEILKIEAELNESQNRVTEKLVQLMTPETAIGSKPAHAILHANTVDEFVTIKPEYQFYYKKRTEDKKATQKLKNIFFSSIQDFKIVNANIKYIACGNSCAFIEEKKEKEQLTKASSKAELPPSTIYLGIETNLESLSLQDVSFYFELDDIENREIFYHYLKHSKWYVNNKEIAISEGFYNSDKLNKINLKSIFKEVSRNTQNINTQTLNYYKKHFITVNSKRNICDSSYSDLDDFIAANQLEIQPNITWVKVEFPRVLSNAILQNVFCSLNAFPVLNREINSFSYQIRNYINILPIKTEDYFLDVKSIVNTNGDVYLPKLKDVLNTGKGNYTVRGNNIGKLDQRSSKEYLIHLIELLKDESASFSFLNNDFLHGNLKKLNQLISLLEKKVASSTDKLIETNYITLEPYSKKENLLVDYWTTNGEEANNIKSGSDIDVYKAIGIKQKGSYLMTTTFDGRNSLNMDERLNSYRRSLLSRDRIVTKEDIKALCYELYNNKIAGVEIKKGYINNIDLHKGMIQCIEIELEPNKKIKLEQNEWDSLNSNLLLLLEKKSVNIFPYKIKILN